MANAHFSVGLAGFKGFDKWVAKQLPRETAAIVRKSVRQGSKIILRKMRSNADTMFHSTARSAAQEAQGGAGRLRRSLGIKAKSYRKTGTHINLVGGSINGGFYGKHQNLVETGSWKGPRPHPITGTSGVMPEMNFVSSSFDQTRHAAMSRVTRSIAVGMGKLKGHR